MNVQPLSNEVASPRSALTEGSVEAATALLNRPTEVVGLRAQLETYSALASRWPQASETDRPALAEALGESQFAQRIQATLTVYTRAAWAGADVPPPQPQKQALAAFDALSAPERQIVAAMRGRPLGEFPLTSVADYRGQLQSDLASAERGAVPQRRPDEVTLSPAAQARLNGSTPPTLGPPPPQPRSPQMAAALEAYAKGLG